MKISTHEILKISTHMMCLTFLYRV